MATTDFFIPHSLDEAVSLLSEHGDELVILGGGTIVMAQVNDGLLFPRKAMSLKRAGIDEVQRNGQLKIGAAATLTQLTRLNDLAIVAQAASSIAAPAVRNAATLGGNLLAHAPYGDMAVPLLALDGQVELRGPGGKRTLPLEQLLSDYRRTARGYDELLTAVYVPQPQGKSIYLRMGRRQANTPSIVAVAANIVLDADGTCSAARIALGAAGPLAMRAKQAEAALTGQRLDATSIEAAAEAAMNESDPPTDALASGWYRRKMIRLYVRQALEMLK